MSVTTKLGLPLLAAAQAQKHVTHNEALLKLDGLTQLSAVSYTTIAQPASPADGELYLLPAGKTGTNWAGAANHAIAHYHDGSWHFYTPAEGWIAWVRDTHLCYVHDGAQWTPYAFSDGTAAAPSISFLNDTDNGLYRAGSNNPALAAAGSKVHSWSTSGNLQPLQPSFLAALSANAADQTGDGTQYTIICDNEIFDQGGNYDPTSGVFTAPVTGRYYLSGVVVVGDVAVGHTSMTLRLNTSNRTYNNQRTFTSDTGFQPINIGGVFDMDAGDTASISIQVSGSTKTVDVVGSTSPRTMLSGCLLA